MPILVKNTNSSNGENLQEKTNEIKGEKHMPNGITIIPMIILGSIFIYGLLNAINPRIMWNLFESWKATKEPNDTFFLFRRIAGIVAMFIVFGLILFPYLMSRQ